MANDKKKKSGFFGLFKKNKPAENVEQVEAPNKGDDYVNDINKFLLTKNLEGTMEMQKVDALGSYEDLLEDTFESTNATESEVTTNEVNANAEQSINQGQEFSFTPQEVIENKETLQNSQRPEVNQTVLQEPTAVAPAPQEQVVPNIEGYFIQPEQNVQSEVRPNVDELIYNDQTNEINNGEQRSGR